MTLSATTVLHGCCPSVIYWMLTAWHSTFSSLSISYFLHLVVKMLPSKGSFHPRGLWTPSRHETGKLLYKGFPQDFISSCASAVFWGTQDDLFSGGQDLYQNRTAAMDRSSTWCWGDPRGGDSPTVRRQGAEGHGKVATRWLKLLFTLCESCKEMG